MAYSRWFQSSLSLILFQMIVCILHSAHAQLSAEEFEARCQNLDKQMFLADKMSETTITCALQVEAIQITWTRESIGSPIVNITQLIGDGSKYESTANRLTVKNLVAGDEGVYKCHYISGSVPESDDTDCVLILGTTRYVTCPSSENCVEDLEVTEGNDISFDVRVAFVNGGSSGQDQLVQLLQLYKGDELLAICNNNANGCDNMDNRIQVVQMGSDIYNLKLTLPGAMTMDAGTYTARIEVILPTTGGQDYILKIFQVTVNPQVCIDGEPRLVGGLNETEGTVEVCYNGAYWTVCDDRWDELDASVVCRQLGYNSEGSVPVDNSASIFGSTNGSTPILLDELACIGNETSLFNCSHEPLGVSDCNQKELAGVICEVDPLSITTQPQEQINIIPGTHVTFTVGATGSSLDYQWLKEGRKLTEGSKYSGTITAALTVIDVMDSDEGEYLCILGNAVDTVLSMEAVLTTLKEPTILDGPEDVLVESGMDVTFSCTGGGSGNMAITWGTSAPNITLPNDIETVNGLEVTSTIMFTASPSFHGNYSCTVTNERGDVTSNTSILTIIVTVGEEFISTTLKTASVAISIISMVALIFTFITITVFRKLQNHNASIFVIQHCIALFCMLLFFVVGIDRIENDIVCTIMSLSIQYFTMAAVLWMGAEAVLIFRQLNMGFERASWKLILVPSLVCWMLPLPLLAVALTTMGTGVNYLISTDDGYCFFSQPGVMFGVFLGPLFSTLLFNVVIFILITRVLLRHRRRKVFADLLKTTTWTLAGAATIAVLFGLTWVFGAVSFTGGADVFLWLFIISNSLQGLCFSVFQKDAQDSWILLFRFCECSICRNRKEIAGENGTLEPKVNPEVVEEDFGTLASVPSGEITVENNGRIISVEHTLSEVAGNKSTEGNPAVALATMEERLDNGGIISVEDTLEQSISLVEESVRETSFSRQEPEDAVELPQRRGLLGQHYIQKLSAQMIIPKEHLRLLSLIGDGEYGIVYKAQICTPERVGSDTDVVAVKTLKGFFDEAAINDMVKESLKMKDFNHPNILNMLGVCIDGGPAPFIVMPFMANGSLRAYLKKERPNIIVPEDADLSLIWNGRRRLVGMCIQIARGMEYLASRKLVHRDLASRNCMIDDTFVIKVADFGLSESVYSKSYFRLANHSKAKLPLKWMAPESLNDGIFTEKTDVWSFGVVCWEIFTGGKAPYAGVHPLALIEMLEDGHRLNKPRNAACSGEMYSIMRTCWHADLVYRPTFSGVVQIISHLQASLDRSPAVPSSTPNPSAKLIMSQVPSQRQHVQNSGQPVSEPYQRTLPKMAAEQSKQGASAACKPSPPKDDYEEITSVYDQFPLPMPEKIKDAAVQSYEEIGGAVYDSFPVLACKDDTKSPVQLNLAEDITTKPVYKPPSVSALRDDSNEEKPTSGIITPHNSENSFQQNAPIVPPKLGVIAAATAGKSKRGTTALHSGDPPSGYRGGKVLGHNRGVGNATNKPIGPLEVFTESDNYETISSFPYESAANYETISKDPYESAANYETISRNPYESVASPYESITASPYDMIVLPTAPSLPLANHDDDREEDENTIGLDDGAPNDAVQPSDPTTPANLKLELGD